MRLSGVRPPPGIQQEDRDLGGTPVRWTVNGKTTVPHNWGPVGRGMPWNLRRYLAKYWGVRRLMGVETGSQSGELFPLPPTRAGVDGV